MIKVNDWTEILKVLGAEDFLADVQSMIGGQITRPKSRFYRRLLTGGKVPVEVTRDSQGIYTVMIKHSGEGGYKVFNRVADLSKIVGQVTEELRRYG